MKLIPGQTPTRLVLFGGILLASTLCPPLLTGIAAPAIAIELVRSIPSVFAGLVTNDMGELAKRLEHQDSTNHDLAKATGEAIVLVLSNLAQTEELEAELKGKFKRLADVAEKQWLNVSQPISDEAASLEISEAELEKLMSRKAEDLESEPGN